MTDPVAVALIAGIPLTLGAIGQLWVILRTKRIPAMAEQVEKIERQTNSMNSTMVDSARKEGRIEGKERAEGIAAVTAATVAATPPAVIPLIVAPEAKQEEIVKWLAQGYAAGVLGEKTRRAVEGNGPKT